MKQTDVFYFPQLYVFLNAHENKEYRTNNLRMFGIHKGLTHDTVKNLVYGRQHSHNHWVFLRLEGEENSYKVYENSEK